MATDADLDALIEEYKRADAVKAAAEAAAEEKRIQKLTAGQRKEQEAKDKAAAGVLKARHVELSRQLKEAQRMRGCAPTKKKYEADLKAAEEKRLRMVEKAKKRQAEMTKEEAMAGDVVASHKMHREDQVVRVDFVRRLTRYAWEVLRPTLLVAAADGDPSTHVITDSVAYPRQFVYRMRFVLMDDAVLEKTFIDTLVIGFSGHVHGVSTDHFDGLEGLIADAAGDLKCTPKTLLEDLPGCSGKASDSHITTIHGFEAEKVPQVQPPWWDIPQVPDTLAMREVLTMEQYNTEWPTTAEALAFKASVRARWAFVNENLEKWRQEFDDKMKKQEMQKQMQRTNAERAPRNVMREKTKQARRKQQEDASDLIV